jgi:hypothetical protein
MITSTRMKHQSQGQFHFLQFDFSRQLTRVGQSIDNTVPPLPNPRFHQCTFWRKFSRTASSPVTHVKEAVRFWMACEASQADVHLPHWTHENIIRLIFLGDKRIGHTRSHALPRGASHVLHSLARWRSKAMTNPLSFAIQTKL